MSVELLFIGFCVFDDVLFFFFFDYNEKFVLKYLKVTLWEYLLVKEKLALIQFFFRTINKLIVFL